MSNYVSSKEVCKKLNIHWTTLIRWAENRKIKYIKTQGNHRRYDLNDYMLKNGLIENNKPKKFICYCRVSTNNQKDDLKRQIEYMKTKYPTYEIISDIGSGINFNRKGLNKLLDYAITNELAEVVLAYKDRLCRIGYTLIENIIERYSKAKITVINKEDNSTEEETVKDLVQVINVFSAKLNGKRKYTKKH